MKMQFNTIIKPTRTPASVYFPNDNCVGLSLTLKDKAKGTHQLRLWFSEAVCKKAGIHMQGKVIFGLSNCSNGMQVVFNPKPDAEYKGFRLIPSGTTKNKEQIIKLGTEAMNCSVAAPLPKDSLDFKRSVTFERKFVDIFEIGKNKISLDISTLPLYIDHRDSAKKPKPSALKKSI